MTKQYGNSDILDAWAASGAKVEPEIVKKDSGWLGGERPAYQYMNFLQNTLFKQINYLMRSGVPEWNAATEYLVHDFVNYSGDLYSALADNTNSIPPSADWAVVADPTHPTSDGSSHTFIDQDVTIGSLPTFTGTNIIGVDHGSNAGLLDDDHPQYLLLAGRTGQQITDDVTLVGDFTFGLNDTDGFTKFEQTNKKLQITLPSVDGTNFFQFLNANGDFIYSINSLGVIQSELPDGFTYIDPFTISDTLYLNTAHSVSITTLNGDSLFTTFENTGKHNIYYKGDSDGTSGEEIRNSDDTAIFGRYSDGYNFSRTSVASTTPQSNHFMDYAGQGTAIGGYTFLVEAYTDRAAIYRSDSVMQGGVHLDLRNAQNAIRRPDLAPSFAGTSDFIYAGDLSGVFYKWLANGEELWLRNSTWKMSHNGTGLNPAYNFRTFQTNTNDFRFQTKNTYIDMREFDNAGVEGFEIASSNTTAGGLKVTASQGKLFLNAYEDINLSSTTGNVHVANTFYVDKDNAVISLTDLDSAHYVFENTSGSGQSKLVFSFNGVAKGGVRGDVLGNFNWHGIGGQGHQFYNSIDNASPAAGISDDGISIGGAAAQVSGDARLKIIGSSDLSDKYLIRSQNSSLEDKFLVPNNGLVTVSDTLEASVIKATNAVFKSSTIIATATYDILATDNFVGLDYTPSGAVTVELPSLAVAWDATNGVGQEITVKDTGGSAGTNIITINRKTATSDTIDGGTFATIDVNDGSLTFRAISSTKWAIL